MKDLTRKCGCRHDGRTWHLCDNHRREAEVEAQMEAELGKPLCPEGCGDARRQKCFWDQGGACPRHDVREDWDAVKSRRLLGHRLARLAAPQGELTRGQITVITVRNNALLRVVREDPPVADAVLEDAPSVRIEGLPLLWLKDVPDPRFGAEREEG